MYFVYILRCVDSSLYCGYTTDVAHRLRAHTGRIKGGAKYTKTHRPVRVERVWKCCGKSDALKLETLFKKLEKARKEELIRDPGMICSFLGEKLDPSRFELAPEYETTISEATDGDMESVARVP